MKKQKQHVVIVGGGFAGVKTAIELCDSGLFDITLVTNRPNFEIYGSLYHTIVGGSTKVSTIPLSEIFAERKINIVQCPAKELDRKAKQIITVDDQKISFDILILALGMVTNYFNIEGLPEYSYGMKSLAEANELKKHIHDKITKKHLSTYHYVVVGGGPSGIELAGMLPSYIKRVARYHGVEKPQIHVDLVEAAPRLLPRLPRSISSSVAFNLRKQGVKIYLNTAVLGQSADELLIHDKPIRSHTVVWTAGMSNNPFFKENNFQTTQNGKVRVDQYLQAEPGIYVLGDNADTPYSGMAQTALYDGKTIARNLTRIAEGKEAWPYRAKKPVYVLPAGPRWAAVVWGRVRFYGYAGYALRRAADFMAYKDYSSWPMTFSRFLAEIDKEESCPHCADDLAK